MLSLFLGLLQLAALLILGEVIADILSLPIPGSIIGMLLFLCLLTVTGKVRSSSRRGSELLIANLILFILPSATGVFFLEQRFTEQWLSIATILIVGTLLSVLTSFLLFMAVSHVNKPDNKPGKEHD